MHNAKPGSDMLGSPINPISFETETIASSKHEIFLSVWLFCGCTEFSDNVDGDIVGLNSFRIFFSVDAL